MTHYGQFCPVAKAAEVFCERWTPLILRDLALGASRFSELQHGVPLASHRLKQLEKEGVVERRKSDERAQLDLPPDTCWAGPLTDRHVPWLVGTEVVTPAAGEARNRPWAAVVGT